MGKLLIFLCVWLPMTGLAIEMDFAPLKKLNPVIRWHPFRGERKIYGRVVDQYGKGVSGACVSITHATSIADRVYLRTLTDQDGLWECLVPPSYSPDCPNFRRIQKYGYEWDYLEYQDDYSLARQMFATTSANRIVSTIRRKASPSYPIKMEGRRMAKFGLNGKRTDGYYNYLSGSGTYAVDRRELFNTSTGITNIYFAHPVAEETLAYDLQFHAKRRADGGGWSLHITPNGEQAGIILWQEEKIYEAPKEGYLLSLALSPDDGEEEKLTLYTKTRHFPLYAEVKLSFYASTQEQADAEAGPWLNVQLDSVTYNPFGKRSLEMDEALNIAFFPKTKEGNDEWDRFQKLCLSFRSRLFLNILPDESELEKFRHIPDYFHNPTVSW